MQALTSSTFRTPTTHIPPAAYTSGLPTPPLHSHPSCCLSFWTAYPPPPLTSLLLPILLSSLTRPPTHNPPAAYPSGLPTPPTHIPPAAYPSELPTPPTHIPPAAYPSGLPNPRPLPPMNALEESITDFSVPLMLAYNFKET